MTASKVEPERPATEEQPDDGDSLPEQRVHRTDVAEDEGPGLPLVGRRRPSGAQRPPFRLDAVAWAWLGLALVFGISWGLAMTRGIPVVLDRFDAEVLRWAERLRSTFSVDLADVVALLGSVWLILALRWGTIAVLAVVRRGRALLTFVASILILRVGVAVLAAAIQRPRPLGPNSLAGWRGESPSPEVAALAVTLVGMAYALLPRGRGRTVSFAVSSACIVSLSFARIVLGQDRPTDDLFAAIFGAAVAVLAFRIFCPEDVFPVTYSLKRGAHLEIDDRRRLAIADALEEQAGLELLSVEPFGEESSGGSTPLRLEVRDPDEDVTFVRFGKLYSDTHLRADRWYKLTRTILYGELEDEARFESVRRLVEYEDYMLRVMTAAGVATVQPRGFVELDPDREYLLMMTLLEGSHEIDRDAELSDEAIDAGLRIVRTMWDHGLAHRDIKPANVLVRGDEVFVIDVAFGQFRPSPWRQAVDLANMMLVLALAAGSDRVYERAASLFVPEEIGEAFSAAQGPAIPRQLRQVLREDDRDLIEDFRRLAPEHEPIAIQRWSVRRVTLAVRTSALLLAFAALVVVNLANPHSP